MKRCPNMAGWSQPAACLLCLLPDPLRIAMATWQDLLTADESGAWLCCLRGRAFPATVTRSTEKSTGLLVEALARFFRLESINEGLGKTVLISFATNLHLGEQNKDVLIDEPVAYRDEMSVGQLRNAGFPDSPRLGIACLGSA